MALDKDLVGLGIPPEQARRLGVSIGTVAGVGTSNTGAAAVTQKVTLLTTAVGQTAFILPASGEVGEFYILFNTSATTALVFPPASGTIDGGTATTGSVNVAQNKGRLLLRVSNTAWVSVAGA